jgi:hypothetical protein
VPHACESSSRCLTAGAHAAATAQLVSKHLLNLSEEWPKLRPFSNAYKHGLLVANPEDVTLVDGHDDTATIEGIVVWQRRRPGTEGYGHILPPYDVMAEYVVAAANIAFDVLEHLVDSRVRIFELIDLRAGTWTPQSLKGTPWRWWFSKDGSPSGRESCSAGAST